jgi:hypothetical protein
MSRKAKEERVQRHDGKVFEIRDVKICEEDRSPNYRLLEHSPAELTPTGHLRIFELLPTSDGQPAFEARWDGGSRETGKQERQDLDIDIKGVSSFTKRRFKNGTHGYSGHHSVRDTSAKGRVYDVEICIPGKRVFKGTVSFSVHRKLGLPATTQPLATLGAVKSLRLLALLCTWVAVRVSKMAANRANGQKT